MNVPVPRLLKRPRICVVGSLNMDLVFQTERFPRPGETVTGAAFATYPGGKGANQAVAAARLGAHVAMIGRVGDDAFGRALLAGLQSDGVDAGGVIVDPGAPTGIAGITVSPGGENTIVVAPGANHALRPRDVDAERARITEAELLMLQMEIPLDTMLWAARAARDAGIPVMLDPAPARPLPPELFSIVDILLPNEGEAAALAGAPIAGAVDGQRAAAELAARGPAWVVVKLGALGAAYAERRGRSGFFPAVPVASVDTTAAGDAFAGALAVARAEGGDLRGSVRFAARAAALKVTRHGAQAGMPRRDEVEEFALQTTD
jgi:ribokinase